MEEDLDEKLRKILEGGQSPLPAENGIPVLDRIKSEEKSVQLRHHSQKMECLQSGKDSSGYTLSG